MTLASLVTEPAHALLVQSYAPCDMRGGGTVNADGFGAGWYGTGGVVGGPAVYRHDRPMWTDASFLDLAGAVSSTAIVAAVRSATVGMAVAAGACAPFRGRAGGHDWLFSHNGVVRGWPHSMADAAETLPAVDLLMMDAPTDSALLWALLRARLDDGQDPEKAVAALVAETLAAAPGSRLNLLLCDGERVIATAVDHALSVRARDDGAVTVASEPLDDDPAWQPVPDLSLLTARPTADGCAPVSVTTLAPT